MPLGSQLTLPPTSSIVTTCPSLPGNPPKFIPTIFLPGLLLPPTSLRNTRYFAAFGKPHSIFYHVNCLVPKLLLTLSSLYFWWHPHHLVYPIFGCIRWITLPLPLHRGWEVAAKLFIGIANFLVTSVLIGRVLPFSISSNLAQRFGGGTITTTSKSNPRKLYSHTINLIWFAIDLPCVLAICIIRFPWNIPSSFPILAP